MKLRTTVKAGRGVFDHNHSKRVIRTAVKSGRGVFNHNQSRA